MVTARDRVIGILVGNLVAYLMFVYVWPVSIARRIDPAIGSLLRGLGELARAADLSGRRRIAAHTLSAVCAVERDLDLLAYEPGSARPSDVWRATRSQTVRSLVALTAPLLLAADHDTALTSGFSHRLDVLADRLERAPSTVPFAGSEKATPLEATPNIASHSLWRLVNVPLMALEIAVPQADQAQRTFDSVRV
jgi:multidrug resistance protein MdtO